MREGGGLALGIGRSTAVFIVAGALRNEMMMRCGDVVSTCCSDPAAPHVSSGGIRHQITMTEKVEWFRRSTWSDHDAAEFNARLARSRGAHRKAQYLRIQAAHLFEAGDEHLTRAALGLLDRLILEFPDPCQLASALALRAESLVDLGRASEALDSYQRAFLARRAFPQVGDDGYLGYAELVLALRRSDLYDSALAVIEEFCAGTQFPIQEFRIAASRALIAAEHAHRSLQLTTHLRMARGCAAARQPAPRAVSEGREPMPNGLSRLTGAPGDRAASGVAFLRARSRTLALGVAPRRIVGER